MKNSKEKCNDIFSMTGFAKSEFTFKRYKITIEIKSLNNRFVDYKFKLPSFLFSLEIPLKKTIAERFKRGSFETYINIKRSDNDQSFGNLDRKKIAEFVDDFYSILKDECKNYSLVKDRIEVRPCDFLRNEFFIDDTSEENKELGNEILNKFSLALDSLQEERRIEGSKLLEAINQHFKAFQERLQIVANHSKSFQKVVTERLNNRFKEFQSDLKIDNQRFLQEVVYYLEKLEISEEINRLKGHIIAFEKLLLTGGEVGRKIDFLLQEFNRETNTIGSKSSVNEISDAVVHMKVELEKIREQALNLE